MKRLLYFLLAPIMLLSGCSDDAGTSGGQEAIVTLHPYCIQKRDNAEGGKINGQSIDIEVKSGTLINKEVLESLGVIPEINSYSFVDVGEFNGKNEFVPFNEKITGRGTSLTLWYNSPPSTLNITHRLISAPEETIIADTPIHTFSGLTIDFDYLMENYPDELAIEGYIPTSMGFTPDEPASILSGNDPNITVWYRLAGYELRIKYETPDGEQRKTVSVNSGTVIDEDWFNDPSADGGMQYVFLRGYIRTDFSPKTPQIIGKDGLDITIVCRRAEDFRLNVKYKRIGLTGEITDMVAPEGTYPNNITVYEGEYIDRKWLFLKPLITDVNENKSGDGNFYEYSGNLDSEPFYISDTSPTEITLIYQVVRWVPMTIHHLIYRATVKPDGSINYYPALEKYREENVMFLENKPITYNSLRGHIKVIVDEPEMAGYEPDWAYQRYSGFDPEGVVGTAGGSINIRYRRDLITVKVKCVYTNGATIRTFNRYGLRGEKGTIFAPSEVELGGGVVLEGPEWVEIKYGVDPNPVFRYRPLPTLPGGGGGPIEEPLT